MLSKKQFDILTLLEKTDYRPTQRIIAKEQNISLGTVNKVLSELTEKDFVWDGKITEEGIAALEPYKVKRAIIFAAGFGSRLVPITLNTPKPLVRVKGCRIIDSLLDAFISAGIDELYLVRGYLAEQFDQLLYKYPTIKFIENPSYQDENNISSAMQARHLLGNSYVCDADLLLYNPTLITKYQYQTNYIGVPVERTDDWCLKTKNGFVTQMCIGGTNCYHMFGLSYWNDKDGKRLAHHIKEVYESPGGKERYWDQVAIDYHINEYQIAMRPCCFHDIIEIDTYRELKELDPSYI
ncbi:MAG: NTP transferase domain-containing protein [Lachnospiraceae bacterium]|jgi:CTP:phosphocholine cytidylyltransferase-like protein|nr:NTP transferase domain-containing protein [Lachnospiraceae bacterium]